jgi:ribonuclease Z
MVFAELRAGYDGPVVQTQDFTVFDVTKEAVVARQAQVTDQLPPTPGKPRVPSTPIAVKAPEWWAEARIRLDDAEGKSAEQAALTRDFRTCRP